MTVLRVPYHLDEHLPGLDLPLRPDEVITTALPAAGAAWDRLAVLHAAAADAVARAARGDAPVVVVSGDCTTALGTMAGLQHAGLAPAIVWLDAHGDLHTPESTASGYPGGMPLRLLGGARPDLIAARLALHPVAEDQIVLAGARDLDPPEVSYLAGAGVRRADVSGLRPEMLPDGPLYVHVDLDVLDPGEVPGLRYPAPGGPPAGPVTGALRMLLATGRVAAVGLACTWHPGHGAAARLGPQLETVLASLSGPPAAEWPAGG